MSEKENEREFYTLVDEEGTEIEFEKIGEAELNGVTYFAMIPADSAEQAAGSDDGFCEYVVLRLEKDENGDDSLVTIDDDDEFDNVADVFDDMFSEEIDYDGKQ
ncbi:MAG: DUF1292 domain-containing protein [Clostridia bacterium]|nr:DUF1292 domain-containing protein [Clostridia bacterium]